MWWKGSETGSPAGSKKTPLETAPCLLAWARVYLCCVWCACARLVLSFMQSFLSLPIHFRQRKKKEKKSRRTDPNRKGTEVAGHQAIRGVQREAPLPGRGPLARWLRRQSRRILGVSLRGRKRVEGGTPKPPPARQTGPALRSWAETQIKPPFRERREEWVQDRRASRETTNHLPGLGRPRRRESANLPRASGPLAASQAAKTGGGRRKGDFFFPPRAPACLRRSPARLNSGLTYLQFQQPRRRAGRGLSPAPSSSGTGPVVAAATCKPARRSSLLLLPPSPPPTTHKASTPAGLGGRSRAEQRFLCLTFLLPSSGPGLASPPAAPSASEQAAPLLGRPSQSAPGPRALSVSLAHARQKTANPLSVPSLPPFLPTVRALSPARASQPLRENADCAGRPTGGVTPVPPTTLATPLPTLRPLPPPTARQDSAPVTWYRVVVTFGLLCLCRPARARAVPWERKGGAAVYVFPSLKWQEAVGSSPGHWCKIKLAGLTWVRHAEQSYAALTQIYVPLFSVELTSRKVCIGLQPKQYRSPLLEKSPISENFSSILCKRSLSKFTQK